MDRWTNAIQALAPPAGDPGHGSGNVPYAPGIMSGDTKTPGSTSELFGNLQRGMQGQQARSGMQMATQAPSNTPQSAGAPMAPPSSGLMWTPEVQGHVMEYLMNMLRTTGRNWRMTTTGGTTGGPNDVSGY